MADEATTSNQPEPSTPNDHSAKDQVPDTPDTSPRRVGGARIDLSDANAIAGVLLKDLLEETRGDKAAQRILLLFAIQRIARRDMKDGISKISRGVGEALVRRYSVKALEEAGQPVPAALRDVSGVATTISDGVGDLVTSILDHMEIRELQGFLGAIESTGREDEP